MIERCSQCSHPVEEFLPEFERALNGDPTRIVCSTCADDESEGVRVVERAEGGKPL